MDYNNERTAQEKDRLFAKLMGLKAEALDDDTDQLALEYFSEWYYPVIRELSRRGGVPTDPATLASLLSPKIQPKEAEGTIQLLKRLGLILVSPDGKTFDYVGENIVPSRRINEHASIRFHHAMMDMAKGALVKFPETEREYNGLTLSLNSTLMPQAKEILRRACMELLKLEEAEQDHREVFQINMQMFPLTKYR